MCLVEGLLNSVSLDNKYQESVVVSFRKFGNRFFFTVAIAKYLFYVYYKVSVNLIKLKKTQIYNFLSDFTEYSEKYSSEQAQKSCKILKGSFCETWRNSSLLR